MKKTFKKLIEYLLIIFQIINLFILVSECSKLWLFIISKIFALIMMFIIHNVLIEMENRNDI